MTQIENTQKLRSSFLQIGWAPLVAIIGTILVVIYGVISTIDNYHDANRLLSDMKLIMILSSIVSLVSYGMSYRGFVQARKEFGLTKAGDAFSSFKVIFLIYIIIGVLMLLAMLLIPSTVKSYANISNTAVAQPGMAAAGGALVIVVYLLLEVFSIVALFIIKSSSAKIAETTNIASFRKVATGAKFGVYCFFLGLVVVIFSLLAISEALTAILSLALLGLMIYALVEWIGGWLGAASEVLRHPVEAEDYNDTPQE